MPPARDPAEVLQQIYLAGFEILTLERYPRAVGVVRGDCIAVVEPSPDGLKMMGTPGWRIGEGIGVLTTKEGRSVFQAKSEIVEATPGRVAELKRFREELERLMSS